jgi:hypothetical protein
MFTEFERKGTAPQVTQAIEFVNAYEDYCRKVVFSKLITNQLVDCQSVCYHEFWNGLKNIAIASPWIGIRIFFQKNFILRKTIISLPRIVL